MRPATDREKDLLVAKLGLGYSPRAISTVEVARIDSLEEFGRLRTSLVVIGGLYAQKTVSRDVFVVAELFEAWQRSTDDFGKKLVDDYLREAADPSFQPLSLLDQPASGWRVIDGNHRAAAYFEWQRRRATPAFSVEVFLLREPLA